MNTEAFRVIWDDIYAGILNCRNVCPYFNYCGGGAPANKLYENGLFDSAETLYCRAMIQRPFDVVLQAIEKDLRISA